jgi:glycosyltransferase involved in cell wall biosynthesis
MRRIPADRQDLVALIVGDGSGRAELEKRAGDRLGRSVLITGRVPRDRVPDYLAAMDLASLPQSVDGVGSFRYTTKLSEYLAAGLPVVTSQIPLSYDLDSGWLWRLPGPAPWHDRYLDALSGLLTGLGPEEIAARRALVPRCLPEFDRSRQVARTCVFLEDLIAEQRGRRGSKGGRP